MLRCKATLNITTRKKSMDFILLVWAMTDEISLNGILSVLIELTRVWPPSIIWPLIQLLNLKGFHSIQVLLFMRCNKPLQLQYFWESNKLNVNQSRHDGLITIDGVTSHYSYILRLFDCLHSSSWDVELEALPSHYYWFGYTNHSKIICLWREPIEFNTHRW